MKQEFNNLLGLFKRSVGKSAIFHFGSHRSFRGNAKLSSPIVVAGLFSTASGIGQSARLCYEGLKDVGCAPRALDLSWAFNQNSFDYPDVDSLQMEDPEAGGTLIVHLNGPETTYGLWKMGLRRWHRKWYKIGYWAWEMTVPPIGWEKGLVHLNEIWVPSEFVRASLSQITTLPIKIVPHAVRPTSQPTKVCKKPSANADATSLTFLAFADGLSSFERKNLLGAVKAYLLAFPVMKSTKLIVKALNLPLYPVFHDAVMELSQGRDDIEILDKPLDVNALESLIVNSDVLISLHRAEGFGLTMAEAMNAGNLVVCTGWSGNMEFVAPDVALLVKYSLIPVHDKWNVYTGLAGAVWADPDLQHAAEYFRRIFDSPESFVHMRERAKAKVSTDLIPEAYLRALD